MFQQLGELKNRKREREEDEELAIQRVQEHRPKRHLATLPLRRSPEYKKYIRPTNQTSYAPTPSPTFADITPVGSDSEDVLPANKSHSFFSPWSSPVDNIAQYSQPSSNLDSSQSTQMQETQAFSDDLEMTDSGLLYPGHFQSDLSTSIVGRIPTPIHSHFSSHIRAGDIADQSMTSSDIYTSSSAGPSPARASRRLPSPISEDGAALSGSLIQSLGDVQMDVEEAKDTLLEEPRATPKKGHTRSKHSLRTWGSFGAEVSGVAIKRGFSMGYRSDCEKCRMKVPGHFSHVITY